MNANASFLFLIIFMIAIGVTMFVITRHISKESSKSLHMVWFDFKQAVEANNILVVMELGIKLCRNPNLNETQLETISNYVEKQIEKFPELNELKLAVMNKKLNWQREAPNW